MDLGLAGRTYVVTGGTAGLGLATARSLVDDGARVVLASRSQERVDVAVRALGGAPRVSGVVADTADPAAAALLVESATATYGRLDGGLLSTGGPPAGPALGVSDEEWRRAFETQFLGLLRCARAVLAAAEPDGALVFVLSSSVRSPIPDLAISNGLRPGLAMVAKTLADEVGPRGQRVNAVLPGRILTDRIRELEAASSPDDVARRKAAIALRRYGEPAELGRVAAFLLSPAASYVTGTSVCVDGGAARVI